MVILRSSLFSVFLSMVCILIILDREIKIALEISLGEFLFCKYYNVYCVNDVLSFCMFSQLIYMTDI